MAIVSFWLGSVGPLQYDDTDTYAINPGDLVSGLAMVALAGEKIIVSQFTVEDFLGPDGNQVLKFLANALGVNYFTMQSGVAGLAPIFSVDGTDSSIGFLLKPKGDAKYVQFWGGSTQYNGARFVVCGRDHATQPGYIYLDYGGYDGVGHIYIRHRGTSSFGSTVADIDANGDLAYGGNIAMSTGKTLSLASVPITTDKIACHNDDFVFFDGLPVILT